MYESACMTEPLGERPAIDAQRRHGFDVRRAIERRFGANPNSEGEGEHTAAVADAFVAAVLAQDKQAVALLRDAIAEVCGPQRQAIDLDAKVYSVVNIVGEDDDTGAE